MSDEKYIPELDHHPVYKGKLQYELLAIWECRSNNKTVQECLEYKQKLIQESILNKNYGNSHPFVIAQQETQRQQQIQNTTRIPLQVLIPCPWEGTVRDYCTVCVKEIADSRHIRYCDLPNVERFCTRAKYPISQSAFEIPIVDCFSCKDHPLNGGTIIPKDDISMCIGRQITWTYGITTIPEREDTYFIKTLESLKNAGFDKPHLFIDGETNYQKWQERYALQVTTRYPNLKIYGNWLLAMWELYLRNPSADRYAIFQDDLIACRNLRQYLEQVEYPNRGYCNLYSFPENELLSDRNKSGWYKSNQMGKGAVALVFNQEAVMSLLGHWHLVKRVQDRIRGVEVVDGAIVEVLNRQTKPEWTEYCHSPGLVQHTGDVSSHGTRTYPKSTTFKGEEFDALDLLKNKVNV